MIPASSATTVEQPDSLKDPILVRTILEKFERSKILEVYFLRIDGRTPEDISGDLEELYQLELNDIKGFLLGQHPQDTLLHKIFRIMS